MINKSMFHSWMVIVFCVILAVTAPRLLMYATSVQYTKEAGGVRLSYDEYQQLYQSNVLDLNEYGGINFVDGDDHSLIVVCADSFVDYVRWEHFEKAQIKTLREAIVPIETQRNEDRVSTLLAQNAF